MRGGRSRYDHTVPRVVPAHNAFIRRLRSAQRRHRLRQALQASLVAVAVVGLLLSRGVAVAAPWVLLALLLAALWVWRSRGTLHAICCRFDQALAKTHARESDDHVLCAYELADHASPWTPLILKQGHEAVARVPLHVVAPLNPRPFALALAACLGLLTVAPRLVTEPREAVVLRNVRIDAEGRPNTAPARLKNSKPKRVADVVSQAFNAAPALQPIGQAIAKGDAVALTQAFGALTNTLPSQAGPVAEAFAIARHALAQQAPQGDFAAPQAAVPGGESAETQPSVGTEEAAPESPTLERLERGLDEAVDICARDPKACGQAVENMNQQLQPLAAGGATTEKGTQAQAKAQANPTEAAAEPRDKPGPTQGARQNEQATTAPGSSVPKPQERSAPGAITGVATQDVAVNVGANTPDRAELVNGWRSQVEDRRRYEAPLKRYRQQAEAVVAKQALPHDRRALVRAYFEQLHPDQLAGGATRE